jgi:hypothetical protein
VTCCSTLAAGATCTRSAVRFQLTATPATHTHTQEYNASSRRHNIRGVVSYDFCYLDANQDCIPSSLANFAVQLNSQRYNDVRAWAAEL